MDVPFFMNNRFKVEEEVNTVTDTNTGVATRLEPRIMKLLSLLVQHQGKVVTRQQIITDVWDDYGNADEGLSQAISFLRKILGDINKELIRTIPKKGYMLTVPVSSLPEDQPAAPPVNPPKLRRPYIVIIAISVITAVVAVVYFLTAPGYTPDSKGVVEPPGADKDTLYQYQEMKEALEQQKKGSINDDTLHRSK